MTLTTDSLQFSSNINGIWSIVLIEELWRLGVGHCCIAPGSRSASLAFALAAHDGMSSHIHFDERGLGFFALGIAKVTGEPVALITTSGTAVANLYPAVIEACQSGVPLIVISADRPPELIDCGTNQAIDQLGIFGAYTGARLDLPTPDRTIPLRWLLSSIDQAFARSCTQGLPLHINCMFREPLYPHQPDGAAPEDNNVYWSATGQWVHSGKPYTDYLRPTLIQLPDARQWQSFAEGNGLLVVGRLPVGQDVEAIVALAECLGWPLLADVQSQLHGHPAAVAHAELVLASETGEKLYQQANHLLQFGGYLTSKRLEQFIASHHWQAYWMVDPAPRRVDPGQRQHMRLICNTEAICQKLMAASEHLKPQQGWADTFYRQAEQVVQRLSSQGPLTLDEQWLGASLAKLLPPQSSLFLGNSLPIRMVQMFSAGHLSRVFANRGASGIDGLIATAAGCAVVEQRPLVLLIGDISFFHDLNSLQLARQSKTPMVIILVNNDGGEIFHITTKGCHGDALQVANDYFVTPHGLNAHQAAALFGINYSAPESVEQFTRQFNQALTRGGCTLIEVITPSGQGAACIEQAVDRVKTL